MDIGTEKPAIVVEPIQDPFTKEAPEPERERETPATPQDDPAPVPTPA